MFENKINVTLKGKHAWIGYVVLALVIGFVGYHWAYPYYQTGVAIKKGVDGLSKGVDDYFKNRKIAEKESVIQGRYAKVCKASSSVKFWDKTVGCTVEIIDLSGFNGTSVPKEFMDCEKRDGSYHCEAKAPFRGRKCKIAHGRLVCLLKGGVTCVLEVKKGLVSSSRKITCKARNFKKVKQQKALAKKKKAKAAEDAKKKAASEKAASAKAKKIFHSFCGGWSPFGSDVECKVDTVELKNLTQPFFSCKEKDKKWTCSVKKDFHKIPCKKEKEGLVCKNASVRCVMAVKSTLGVVRERTYRCAAVKPVATSKPAASPAARPTVKTAKSK